MSLRQRLSQLARSWRAPRRSLLAAAARLERLETLASAQRFEDLRRRCAPHNPLLAYGAKHYSQNDEDGLIEEITRRTLGERAGSFLELGVGDGRENNTLNLVARGWRGVWLGGEPLAFASEGPRLRFRQCWIALDNVATLCRETLDTHGIAQPDLVSLDLDGNDHHLCARLVASGLKPAVWVVEYNARFSPLTRWVMPYDPQHRWDGSDHFGASLAAFHELLGADGYRLVACNITGANAFFVRADLAPRFPELPEDWRRLYMAAEYLPYPSFAHPASLRTIESLLK
ncbi:MAG TPA: hypothetical protein VF169_13375 [Albitalea sp.]|uniref:hypothetical protein n=1 Tax=Piscinibacter sp. TaxID=1903157 RepID=UPI002ED27FA3